MGTFRGCLWNENRMLKIPESIHTVLDHAFGSGFYAIIAPMGHGQTT